MKFSDNTFMKKDGVYYPQIIREIKKSTNPLQPIYEAVTNSLESIELLNNPLYKGKITIKVYFTKNLLNELEFEKIIFEDNGKGFDDDEFNRFLTYKDSRKGFSNKGSGRIQYVHFFRDCEFLSIFKKNGDYNERNFIISKDKRYIETNNTLTFLKYTKQIESSNTGTILKLSNLIDEKDKSHYLFQIEDLKEKLLHHYIQKFCLNKETLPNIFIEQYINNEYDKNLTITKDDIPSLDNSIDFKINYFRIKEDAKELEKTTRVENFNIKVFKINKDKLSDNSVKLTSKNEVVELERQKINLNCISNKDSFDNNRFLFLISSDYINERDSDERGNLKIPTSESFKKEFNLFQEEEILLEDIELNVNENIKNTYPEIAENFKKKINDIDKLKDMFMLNDDLLKNLSISINDTEEAVLEKFYTAESKQSAKSDSIIKQQIEKLENLDPSSKDYENDFNTHINNLTKEIPLQNRKNLTHYIARRKLVLEVFNKILDKKLKVQNDDSRNNDEELLHNLIFKQKHTNPELSDLWILNEDFMYFKGASESRLIDVQLNGKNVFKQEFEHEEEKYLTSLGQNRKIHRPDILLFPDEGKCIIIEFKAPNVNVSEHLSQINKYASLIRNYSNSTFEIKTFYGYLIGEAIENKDVLGSVSTFEEAYNFDYLFSPSQRVIGFNGKDNGSIYTEVIKYSTLLKRAKNRNKIFIEKLSNNSTL